MKNLKSIIWGLVLITLGIIIGLNAFEIINVDIFFDGWWTLFIIVPCFIGIITEEKLNYLLEMRASGRDRCEDYADKFGVPFYKGEKPWGVKVDIAMPCATQNEVGIKEAKEIIANGTKYYIEVANMPTTEEALNLLIDTDGIIVAPSKAVNAGGVCVSGLEMSQNSQRLSWTAEEVDTKLHNAMKNIYHNSVAAAEKYDLGYNLVAGANIAGFEKVAEAMMEQGIY